jgi:hypothetical protein
MALNPLEQARLTSKLLELRAQLLAGALNPIELARVTAQTLELYTQLGGVVRTAPASIDAEQASLAAADDGLSDDPNSENYRYKDTGYISGSRKEQAAASIKAARDAGQMLRTSDIDFKAIEENPRQARELIKKSNLFGQVDWEGLEAGGMQPQAGYLIDRLYAAVAVMPSEDNPEARKSYALGIETLRTRLEQAKTVEDVTETMTEIAEELLGTRLNADESARYSELGATGRDLSERRRSIEAANSALQNAMYEAGSVMNKATYALENRKKRGWKIDPSHDQEVADAIAAYNQAQKAWGDELAATKDERDSLRDQYGDVWQEQNAIKDAAKARNLQTSESRAWMALGERFVKATMYRKLRGSDSFAGHVANAKAGEPKSWAWTTKEKAAPKRASQKKISFTLKVVESFERVGGRPVAVASTKDLERLCGFRAVQSGNWVLADFVSAKWHVEQTAGAMMDMADVLGIDENHLGFGGRLAMAFGARGTGGKGAARAHYEPVERVMNMTKMNGGGAMGHEHWHALDNIMPSLLRGEDGARDEFASSNHELMPPGAIREAFKALNQTITTGSVRLLETIKLPPRALEKARFNLEGRTLRGVALDIKNAGNVHDAVLAVDQAFINLQSKAYLKQKKQWREIAAAYHSPEGATEVQVKSGASVSNYFLESQALDDGVTGKYWSEPFEMSARAFQAYLEDRLTEMGRKNDYLSCLADNKFHYMPELGAPFKPYPEGEERKQINAAFDQVFKALRDEKAFEKAMGNTALLDSIFGVKHD